MALFAILLMRHGSAWAGTEGVGVVLEAGEVVSPIPRSTEQDSTQAEAETETVASPAPKSAVTDSTHVDSGRAAGGFRKTTGRRSARIVRKLGVGVFSGSVLSIVSRHKDFGSGYTIGPAVGATAGAIVSVISVDPPSWSDNRRSLFLALAGSSVGALVGSMAVPDPSSVEWYDLWPFFVSPAIGATLASELWRDPSQVSRLPIGLKRMEVVTDTKETGKRITKKLTTGALVGLTGGFLGAAVGFSLAAEDCPGGDEGDFCGLGAALAGLFVGGIGYSVGTAIGVSVVDPHDLFIMSLGGSVVGLIGGVWLTSASGALWPSLFVSPVAFATMMSELSRSPSEARRVSIGLMPSPRHLSMVATLRF